LVSKRAAREDVERLETSCIEKYALKEEQESFLKDQRVAQSG